MTSPPRGGPDTAGTREALRQALHRDVCDALPEGGVTCDDVADALLVVVQDLAAKELRAEAVCPTPCDVACDASCHEAHTPSWKRLHQPEHCPSRLLHERAAALASPAPAPRAESTPLDRSQIPCRCGTDFTTCAAEAHT